MSPRVTRLAPSPTGALHLGNARTFLTNFLLAKQNGWRIALRIDDLDGPRIKPHADRLAIDDLHWLGLSWDEGRTYQSTRLSAYRETLDELIKSGDAYPCVCTRREVDLAASAPHAEDGATVYPGTCRDRFASVAEAEKYAGRPPAIRFRVPDERVAFHDSFAGERSWDVAQELGDFVIAKSDGTPAYQLSVVVDDLASGVTDIVRGDDLLDSTPRQILLYRALAKIRSTPLELPTYTHVPLVVGDDGRRLAKRHGDTRLATYRESGVPASRMLALMGRWLGIEAGTTPLDIGTLLKQFELSRLSREAIIFTATDDRFLRTNVFA